jgi:hypothetical protein
MTYPATNSLDASELVIDVGNQLYEVVNKGSTESVTTESGEIPSVRKAIADSLLFKAPIDWVEGNDETDYLQLRTFTDGVVYYAPLATSTNIIPMGATPVGDSNWRVAPISLSKDFVHITSVARSLNVADDEVIYSTDTTTTLDNVLYIYAVSTQTTWRKPDSVGVDETIVSVVGDAMTTSGGSYTLRLVSPPNYQLFFEQMAEEAGIVPDNMPEIGVNSKYLEALKTVISFAVGSVGDGFAGKTAVNGRQYFAAGWKDGSDYGGGIFIGRSLVAKSEHDGINVVSPTVPGVASQAGATYADRRDAFLAGTGETDPAGVGVFVREDGAKSAVDAGAVYDGVTDNAGAEAAFGALPYEPLSSFQQAFNTKQDARAGVIFVSPAGDNAEANARANVSPSGYRYYPVPYASIVGAAAAAQPGDRIVILPGAYTESGSLVSGVFYYACTGVDLVNCRFGVVGEPGLDWRGHADITMTTGNVKPIFEFINSPGATLELRDIDSQNTVDPNYVLNFIASGASVVTFRNAVTERHTLFRYADSWNDTHEKHRIKGLRAESAYATTSAGSLTSYILVAIEGAEVDVEFDESASNNNPSFAVGTPTGSAPGSEQTTRVNLIGGRHTSNYQIWRYFGDTTSSTFVKNFFECTRNARLNSAGPDLNSWVGSTTDSNLRIFGECFANQPEENWVTNVIGTFTITAEA